MKLNSEEQFLYDFIIKDADFKAIYSKKEHKDTFERTIEELVLYCMNSEFNPYLDVEYLDVAWLRDNKTGKIYNLDDIYEVYKSDMECDE